MQVSNRVISILLFCSFIVYEVPKGIAQTTDTLRNVIISDHTTNYKNSKTQEFSPGLKVRAIDSNTLAQYKMQSMADLLSRELPVYVKSYGVNGLSTISFRGASAAQSAVYWNGVPIQNAALGVADISTLPVFFMDQVQIVYGSSAALWGSGNVGGALMLESDPVAFSPHSLAISVALGMGSFGQYTGGVEASVANKHWYMSVKVLGQNVQNDFPYTDANGNTQHMPNSQMGNDGAELRLGYKTDNAGVFSFTAWYQQYDREIPPALFEPGSDKVDNDRSLRLLLDWDHHHGANAMYVKFSMMKDDNSYNDSELDIHASATVYQYYGEAGWRKNFKKFGQLLIFVPFQTAWMQTDSGLKYQNKVAVASAYEVKSYHQKLNAAVNARYEICNGNGVLLPGTDLSFKLTNYLLFRGNAQYTYRLPTLNELYYVPGGNQNLLPEAGWNKDAGYSFHVTAGRFMLISDGALYDRWIHNWIIWLGGAIWTPHNIAEVHSHGVETENRIEYTVGQWKGFIDLATQYGRSVTEASNIPNDGSIGKQVPYTPRYSGNVKGGISYRKLTIGYFETYTGYRFTTNDNSGNALAPYTTGNIYLMYHFIFGVHDVQCNAQCNNIFNTPYQVVAQRPMPGINWQAGLRFRVL